MIEPQKYGKPMAQKKPSQTSEQLTQDWGFEHTRVSTDVATLQHQSQPAACNNGVNGADKVVMEEAASSSLVQKETSQTSALSIPGFNPYDYGHPGKESAAKAHPSTIKDISQQVPQPQPDLEYQIDQEIEPQGHANQPEQSRSLASRSSPLPPVYATLKKEGESPQQTLARLKVMKQHEVMVSAHRRSDKLNTANLAELKDLRGPHALATVDLNREEMATCKRNTHQRQNWAMASEIKPDGDEGSTMGSMSHMGLASDHGREESSLLAWDGNLLPPPVDWDERARYGNNASSRNKSRRWLFDTVENAMSDAVPRLSFNAVPYEVVSELSLHPDGLGFVPKDTTLTMQNGKHYGYDFRTDSFLKDPSGPAADFDGDCKMDSSIPTNLPYREETAQDLIARKMSKVRRELQEEPSPAKQRATQDAFATTEAECVPVKKPGLPRFNIYLRPAVRSDIPGMTAILNWHIQNGVRTSELAPIPESDMRIRVDMVSQNKLPFIVAIERGRKNLRQRDHIDATNRTSSSAMAKNENVVGWTSATDWSANDYAECITADLELYVHHEYRKKGVGRCLMDALLEATDRGYMRKGGYDFTVAPEIQHLYLSGGGRDLHKMIFQLRSYNMPQTPEQKHKIHVYSTSYQKTVVGDTRNGFDHSKSSGPEVRLDFSKKAKLEDREDDYQVWLKEWLESFGFKEEACITKMGTKNQRFLDIRFLTRETHWQPVEHKLTDYAQHPI